METFRYPRRFKLMTFVSAVVFSVMTVALLGWAEYNGVRHLEIFALILLVLLLYAISMLRNSTFLKPEALAAKLKPLVWTEYGDTVELGDATVRFLPGGTEGRPELYAERFA